MAVLRELAARKSSKQIADALHIAEGAANLHAARVYEKLGVSSRTEALTAAWRRGLIRLPESRHRAELLNASSRVRRST